MNLSPYACSGLSTPKNNRTEKKLLHQHTHSTQQVHILSHQHMHLTQQSHQPLVDLLYTYQPVAVILKNPQSILFFAAVDSHILYSGGGGTEGMILTMHLFILIDPNCMAMQTISTKSTNVFCHCFFFMKFCPFIRLA